MNAVQIVSQELPNKVFFWTWKPKSTSQDFSREFSKEISDVDIDRFYITLM